MRTSMQIIRGMITTFKKWFLFCCFSTVYKTDRKGNDLFNLVPRVSYFHDLSLREPAREDERPWELGCDLVTRKEILSDFIASIWD